MKKILFSTAAIVALSLSSSEAAQLLLNGNFEAPALTTTGDHVGTLPTSWNVATSATGASVAADSNLVKGTVTTGTGLVGNATPLPPDPNDTTPGASQSLDGDGMATVVYQDFTMPGLASKVDVKIDFGGRDYTSGTGTGASWQILDPATGYSVVSSLATAINPTTGAWTDSNTVTTQTLTAGKTYRFAVSLPDPDMVDGASITTVPEPSTFAGIGLGFVALLGWFGVKRPRLA